MMMIAIMSLDQHGHLEEIRQHPARMSKMHVLVMI